MTKQGLLLVLKKREKALLERIEADSKSYERLKYKSRRVRHSSPLNNRIGWFTDRLQELQLVISLLEGRVNNKDFVSHKNTDRHGQLATIIGDICFM